MGVDFRLPNSDFQVVYKQVITIMGNGFIRTSLLLYTGSGM